MAELQAGVKLGPGFGADPKHDPFVVKDYRGAIQQETLDNLAKIGGTVFSRLAKKQQEEAFMDGMTRAALGETTAAAENNPALEAVFGTPAAALGARAGESQRLATEYLTGLQARMPELRKLSQPEFTKQITAEIQALKTSDPSLDLVLQQRILQTLPDTTRQWSREHAAYTQEQTTLTARQVMRGEVQSAFGYARNAQVSPASADPAIAENAMARLLGVATTPPPGVEVDQWHSWFGDEIAQSLASSPGGLGPYQFLKTNKVIDAMPPAQRAKIEAAARQAARARSEEVRTKDRSWDRAYVELWENSFKMDAKQFDAAVAGLNTGFAQASGIPEDLDQLVGPDDYKRMLGAQEADRRRAEAEAKRERKEAQRHSELMAGQRAIAEDLKARRDAVLMAFSDPNRDQARAVAEAVALPAREREDVVRSYLGADFSGPNGQPLQPGTPEFNAAVDRRVTAFRSMGTGMPDYLKNTLPNAMRNKVLDYNGVVALATLDKMDPVDAAKFLPADLQNLHKVYQSVVGRAERDPKTGAPKEPTEVLWQRARTENAMQQVKPVTGKEAKALKQDLLKELNLPDDPTSAFILNATAQEYGGLVAFSGNERLKRAAARVVPHMRLGTRVVVDGTGNEDLDIRQGLKPGGAGGTLSARDEAEFGAAFDKLLTQHLRTDGEASAMTIFRETRRGKVVFRVSGARRGSGDDFQYSITADEVWAEIQAMKDSKKLHPLARDPLTTPTNPRTR